jgi:hypothetical protein
MSLADLVTLIQDTNAKIVETEEVIASNPDDFSSLVNLQSLEKRLNSLQQQFNEAAALNNVEVLRYRLLLKPQDATVRLVNDLLATFQQSFTIIYDAIKSRTAKKRARVSESITRESAFGFAYSFSGSLGFALTLPREMALITDEHHAAIRVIEDLAKANDEAEIKSFAAIYGLGAIRTIYKWFDSIAKNGVDSELKWEEPGKPAGSPFLIQVADAQAVRNLIAQTSDTEYDERTYRGTLVGYDSVRRTFRFSVRNVTMIRGSVSDRITGQLKVPGPCDISVRVATISRYSTEEKEERFELLEVLTNPSPGHSA